jgi:hypothetical protein
MKAISTSFFKFKMTSFVFVISICLFLTTSSSFAAVVTWDGGGGLNKDWSNPLNWSNDLVPGVDDQVIITGGYLPVISNNVGTINKLVVGTSTAAAAKLTITSSGILIVNSSVGTQNQVSICGGIVENNGTLSIINSATTGTSIGLNFTNSYGGFISSSAYLGTGILSINASAASGSSCINFAQSDANSSLSVGGTFNLIAPVGKYAIVATTGSAIISGTGSLSVGTSNSNVNFGLLNMIGTANAAQLTVESGVILESYSNYAFSIYSAPLFLGSNLGNNTLTNKGTINIGGVNGNNGFYSGASTGITNTLSNQGTINFNGSFLTSALTCGGVGTFNFTNSGSVSISKLTTTSSKGINISASSTVNVSNTGSITFDANNASTGVVIMLGDSKTTFTNTGTVTLNKGGVAGSTTGTGSAAVYNNAGGVFTINNTTGTAINLGVVFNNAGGLLQGAGGIFPGTFISSTGTIAPGGPQTGVFNFYATAGGSTTVMTGNFNLNVNGKTTAGTDYDKINITTALSNIDISGVSLTVLVGYKPVVHDSITLVTAASNVVGKFATVSLPIGWSVYYGKNAVKIVCDSVVLNTSIGEFDASVQLVYGIHNAIVLKQCSGNRITILNMQGMIVKELILNSDNEQLPMEKGLYIVKGVNFSKKLIVN